MPRAARPHSSTDGGSGSPAVDTRRSRSGASSVTSPALASARNIVGAPARFVTPCERITSTMVAGEKAPRYCTEVAPSISVPTIP